MILRCAGDGQRGLSSGFLWAMGQPPATVRALLEQCILNDPRLDHQVESLGDYYAQLVLGTGMDLAPLEHRLRNDDDRDYTESKALLPIETLGALAKRGYRKATRILRDYVRHGFNWEGGLQELSEAGEELRRRITDGRLSARRVVLDEPGAPCRQCLQPGTVGEEMLLFTYQPFRGDSPYAVPSPIFLHFSNSLFTRELVAPLPGDCYCFKHLLDI